MTDDQVPVQNGTCSSSAGAAFRAAVHSVSPVPPAVGRITLFRFWRWRVELLPPPDVTEHICDFCPNGHTKLLDLTVLEVVDSLFDVAGDGLDMVVQAERVVPEFVGFVVLE